MQIRLDVTGGNNKAHTKGAAASLLAVSAMTNIGEQRCGAMFVADVAAITFTLQVCVHLQLTQFYTLRRFITLSVFRVTNRCSKRRLIRW